MALSTFYGLYMSKLPAHVYQTISLVLIKHSESVNDLSNALGLHAFGDVLRRSRQSRSQKPLSLHAAMASSAAYSDYSQANVSQTTTPSLSVRQSDPRSESSLGTTASSVSSIDRAVTPALDPASASATTFPAQNVDYDDECNEPEQVHTHQRNLSLESNKQKKRPRAQFEDLQSRKSIYGMGVLIQSSLAVE